MTSEYHQIHLWYQSIGYSLLVDWYKFGGNERFQDLGSDEQAPSMESKIYTMYNPNDRSVDP